MAPRKNTRSNNSQKQVQKTIVKKNTGTAKNPTEVKITIPISKLLDQKRKGKAKEGWTEEDKLSISNQVARAQLVPGLTKIVLEVPNEMVPDSVPPQKRCNRRSSVVSSKFSTNNQNEVIKSAPKRKAANKNVNRQRTPSASTKSKKKAPEKILVDIKPIEAEKCKQKSPVKRTVTPSTRCLRSSSLQGKESDVLLNKGPKQGNDDAMSSSVADSQSTSNISWDKDISSSATTSLIAVSSSDLVCFDSKYPFVNITPINLQAPSSDCKAINNNSQSICTKRNDILDITDNEEVSKGINIEDDSSSTSSSSYTSSSSSCDTSSMSLAADIPSLNLSVTTADSNNDSNKIMDMLARVDLTDIGWASCIDICSADVKSQEEIASVLNIERKIILSCKKLNKLLVEDSESVSTDFDDFVKPKEICRKPRAVESESKTNEEVPAFAPVKDNEFAKLETTKKLDVTENSPWDHDNTLSSYEHFIDDDALSLFAESITGIESSKPPDPEPISNGFGMEEYVPQPVNESSPTKKKLEYCPTKINKIDSKKTLCEKQNADSTSVNKETNCNNVPEHISIIANESPKARVLNTPCADKIDFIFNSNYTPIRYSKSLLFSGICYYNLVNNCRNENCQFSHIELNRSLVVAQLKQMTDDDFIEEYMLLRTLFWPRKKYGICFVEESIHRKLTSMSFHIVIDFIKMFGFHTPENKALNVEVTEVVLLDMNNLNVSLNAFKDILLHKINANTNLSNHFIKTIAETQNFSRFKMVFLNLTYFIVQNGGSFVLEVAEQLLERICILPVDKSLYFALFDIITHTEKSIFKNKMFNSYKSHLRDINPDCYNKLMFIKMQLDVGQEVVRNNVGFSSQSNNDIHTKNMDKERYTSPDTTNVENMINPAERVTNRTMLFRPNTMRHFHGNSSASDEVSVNAFHNRPSTKPVYMQRHSRPMRGFPNLSQRHVSYRNGTNSYYNRRRPPPNF